MNKKEKFIKKGINKFNNKFDYTNSNYIDSKNKIEIKCNEHDIIFNQTPAEHLRGKNGCVLCQTHKIKKEIVKLDFNKNKLLNNDKFIFRAKIKHGDKYNYSKIKYIDSKTKLIIICPVHGEFEQLPTSHIRGKGCNLCGIEKRVKTLTCTNAEFVCKSLLIHNNKYDYSKVIYLNSQTKVTIVCPVHGEFEQLPYDHLSNHGCGKCTSSISNGEKEINTFLLLNGIKTITSSMSIIKPNQLDIFIPKHNLAIEYNGLYWHNETRIPNDYHLNKINVCQKQGIRLIHIFEDEWLNKQEIVKSRLLNILGFTQNKIYGRKTEIKDISNDDARQFLDNNHLQGFTNSTIRLGLFYNNELVSVMLFNKPRLGIGVSYNGYELTRFASRLNTTIIGGADKLLNYFVNNYKPKQIISYADRRWSQGELYKTLGFTETHTNKPNYWYIVGKNRKHRFMFRKERLKKDGFDTINKTEHQIMLDRKIYRIYDCGTITYKKLFSY